MESAPFILGVDLTHLDPQDLQKYLENTAVLAVDQDSIAAKRVVNTGNQQVFAKTEPNGDAIVGLFNTGEKAEKGLRTSICRGPPRERKRLFAHRPVDRQDEENRQHHQCYCSIAWGRPIPRQGTLNYSIADDPIWISQLEYSSSAISFDPPDLQ